MVVNKSKCFCSMVMDLCPYSVKGTYTVRSYSHLESLSKTPCPCHIFCQGPVYFRTPAAAETGCEINAGGEETRTADSKLRQFRRKTRKREMKMKSQQKQHFHFNEKTINCSKRAGSRYYRFAFRGKCLQSNLRFLFQSALRQWERLALNIGVGPPTTQYIELIMNA